MGSPNSNHQTATTPLTQQSQLEKPAVSHKTADLDQYFVKYWFIPLYKQWHRPSLGLYSSSLDMDIKTIS
jgi:hypothetical protein